MIQKRCTHKISMLFRPLHDTPFAATNASHLQTDTFRMGRLVIAKIYFRLLLWIKQLVKFAAIAFRFK